MLNLFWDFHITLSKKEKPGMHPAMEMGAYAIGFSLVTGNVEQLWNQGRDMSQSEILLSLWHYINLGV